MVDGVSVQYVGRPIRSPLFEDPCQYQVDSCCKTRLRGTLMSKASPSLRPFTSLPLSKAQHPAPKPSSCGLYDQRVKSPPTMTSPPESHRNFHPHGSRSEILLLPPRSDDFMTSQPWTAMYLISPPLPRGVSAVQFNITSQDQGWCSDRNQGIWSWFDVSILCSDRDGDEEDPSSFLSDLSDHPSSYLKSRPEDFRQVLQDRGLHFKDISKQEDPAKPGCIAKRVASNKIQRSWQQHVIFWRVEDGGEEAEFLSFLEEGDRLVVWARTQFSGWINCVKSVEIKISVDETTVITLPASGGDSESCQEDTVNGVL